MYNRTLNRPMFRRGGRAGGGIMTGVETPKRGHVDGPGSYAGDEKQVESITRSMDVIDKIAPRYNNMGSDFFMGLGANILSQPGGQPIFQTLGTAAKEPLNLLMKQNIAEYGNKRDTVMEVFKQLSDEDKDAMINRAEQMVAAGRFKTVQEALQVLVPTYRKDASPTEIERKEKLDTEKLNINRVDDLVKIYEIGRPDAVVLDGFFNDIESQKFEVPHDPEQYFIDDSEVGRGQTDAEKRLVIRDYDPEQSDYKEGRVYIDFITKKAFVKQGQFFIPYEEYISETISTD